MFMNNLLDIKKASKCLTESFYNYPIFTYLLPVIKNREKKLKIIITFSIKLGVRNGEVITSSNCEECASIWYFPYNKNISFLDVINAGIIKVILIIGLKDFITLMKFNNYKSNERNILLKDNNYYFLDMIGVNPNYQKKGLASSILKSKINDIKNEGYKCYLETSNKSNITFYQKLGFKLVKEYSYNGLPVYCLLND